MSLVLKNCRAVITPISSQLVRVMENVSINIHKGTIVNIGSSISKSQTAIDCSEFIVLPGFVDCHIHIASSIIGSKAFKAECDEVSNLITFYEEKLSNEKSYHAAKILSLKSLISGTTVASIYGLPNTYINKLEKETGLRLFSGSLVRGKRHFPSQQYLDKSSIFFTYLKDDYEDAIQRLKELLRKGLRIAIHLPLSGAEILRFRSKYGYFPIEFLNKFDILRSNISLLHVDWITSWEIQLLSRANVGVVISPISTAIYACRGFSPINELIKYGISVGLGTDLGLACGLNIIDSFKLLFMLYRHSYGDLRVGIELAFYTATAGGYKVLGLKGGIIKPGYLADLVLVKANYLDIEDLPYSLLNLKDHSIEVVIVNGRIAYYKDQKEHILKIIKNERKYLK